MTQQRAAIIGLGVWGQRLTRVLARSEKVRIAVGVSRTPSKLAPFGAQHGFPIVDDFDAVLRASKREETS
jgi:predicted dehydrogenase